MAFSSRLVGAAAAAKSLQLCSVQGSVGDGHRALMVSCVPTGTVLPSPIPVLNIKVFLSTDDLRRKRRGFLLS